MAKVSLAELNALPKTQGLAKPSAGTDFGWIDKVDKIVGNVKALFDQMQQIQQGAKPASTPAAQSPVNTTPRGNMENKTKMFLLMFLASLQNDGQGKVPIGKIIADLPDTVDQVIEYVKKL